MAGKTLCHFFVFFLLFSHLFPSNALPISNPRIQSQLQDTEDIASASGNTYQMAVAEKSAEGVEKGRRVMEHLNDYSESQANDRHNPQPGN